MAIGCDGILLTITLSKIMLVVCNNIVYVCELLLYFSLK